MRVPHTGRSVGCLLMMHNTFFLPRKKKILLWMRRLITKVQPWAVRKHGEIDYFITQFLSRHGYVRLYLKKDETPSDQSACTYCSSWELRTMSIIHSSSATNGNRTGDRRNRILGRRSPWTTRCVCVFCVARFAEEILLGKEDTIGQRDLEEE